MIMAFNEAENAAICHWIITITAGPPKQSPSSVHIPSQWKSTAHKIVIILFSVAAGSVFAFFVFKW